MHCGLRMFASVASKKSEGKKWILVGRESHVQLKIEDGMLSRPSETLFSII